MTKRTLLHWCLAIGMAAGNATATVARAENEDSAAPEAAAADTDADAPSGGPDASLTPKGKGCQWRVPQAPAAANKKSKHKRPTVANVVLDDVPCTAIRMIALRGDGQKAAITSATEGAPKPVESTPGTVAMVYPLTYRMFEVDLLSGRVAEFGLPKLKFPGDPRPIAAVGYNRRDGLVIVAHGSGEHENQSVLMRFTPSRQGWAAQKPDTYRTDAAPEPETLCGPEFMIHAKNFKDELNPCVND